MFRELGYTVTDDGREFVAERKWRRVLVTTISADGIEDLGSYLADGGATPRLRCFVTWDAAASELREQLVSLKPPYDWAVIGVDGEDFTVMEGAPGSP